jgi:hypothetical protein
MGTMFLMDSCWVQSFQLSEFWDKLETNLALAKRASHALPLLDALAGMGQLLVEIDCKFRTQLSTWNKRIAQDLLLLIFSWENRFEIHRLATVCTRWCQALPKLGIPPHVPAVPVSFRVCHSNPSPIRKLFLGTTAPIHSHQDHYHILMHNGIGTLDSQVRNIEETWDSNVNLDICNFAFLDSLGCFAILDSDKTEIHLVKSRAFPCQTSDPTLFPVSSGETLVIGSEVDAHLLAATNRPEPHIIYSDGDLIFYNVVTRTSKMFRHPTMEEAWMGLEACDGLVFAMSCKFNAASLLYIIQLYIFSATGIPLARYLVEVVPKDWKEKLDEPILSNKWMSVTLSNGAIYHVHIRMEDPDLRLGALLVEKRREG